jgi:hypothetical protein
MNKIKIGSSITAFQFHDQKINNQVATFVRSDYVVLRSLSEGGLTLTLFVLLAFCRAVSKFLTSDFGLRSFPTTFPFFKISFPVKMVLRIFFLMV